MGSGISQSSISSTEYTVISQQQQPQQNQQQNRRSQQSTPTSSKPTTAVSTRVAPRQSVLPGAAVSDPLGHERAVLSLATDYRQVQQQVLFGTASNAMANSNKQTANENVPAVVFRANSDGLLDLSKQGFAELPAVVFGLGLVGLDLSENCISELPSNLGDLTSNLQMLILAGNRLQILPQSIGNLTKLKMIHLADNQLVDLPDEIFSNLVELEEFHVDFNRLKRLPPLHNHVKLKGFSADGNDFRDSNSIPSLPSSIEILHLNNCNLVEFPRAIASCTCLKEIGLSENSISILPTEFLSLNNIEEFFISCSQLTALPEGFGGQFLRLSILDLSYNNFSEFPEEITSLPNLTKLNISGNPLCDSAEEVQPHLPIGDLNCSIKIYWQFPMPDQIQEGLYLGGFDCAKNRAGLKRLGISHIITVGNLVPLYPQLFQYLSIPVEDNPNLDILVHFQACNRFISEALSSSKTVLVHCENGKSSSATIVIAFLMATKKCGFKKALSFVKSKRSAICPNEGFLQQLQLYEQQLAIGRVLLDNAPTSAYAAEINLHCQKK